MRKNGWQFFLLLFSPIILFVWGAIWLYNLYLKLEGVEEKK